MWGRQRRLTTLRKTQGNNRQPIEPVCVFPELRALSRGMQGVNAPPTPLPPQRGQARGPGRSVDRGRGRPRAAPWPRPPRRRGGRRGHGPRLTGAGSRGRPVPSRPDPAAWTRDQGRCLHPSPGDIVGKASAGSVERGVSPIPFLPPGPVPCSQGGAAPSVIRHDRPDQNGRRNRHRLRCPLARWWMGHRGGRGRGRLGHAGRGSWRGGRGRRGACR